MNIHQTSRSRAGRRFPAVQEAALYPAALKAAKSLPGASSGVLLVPEMSGPLGVPDFLAMVGGRKALELRLDSGVPPVLSELDCSLIAALFPLRAKSVNTLASELGWSEELVLRRLTGLAKVGAVTRNNAGRFIRHSSLSVGGNLYAIETKVRNWQQAVRQARGYRTWVNNYVLVFGPLGERSLISATAAVVSDSAGLVVDGKWTNKPTPRRLRPQKALLGFEHLIASLENYQPSPRMNNSTPARKGSTHDEPPMAHPDAR